MVSPGLLTSLFWYCEANKWKSTALSVFDNLPDDHSVNSIVIEALVVVLRDAFLLARGKEAVCRFDHITGGVGRLVILVLFAPSVFFASRWDRDRFVGLRRRCSVDSKSGFVDQGAAVSLLRAARYIGGEFSCLIKTKMRFTLSRWLRWSDRANDVASSSQVHTEVLSPRNTLRRLEKTRAPRAPRARRFFCLAK